MARTIYPVEAKSWALDFTPKSLPHPQKAARQNELREATANKENGADRRPTEEQSYLERVQNYIPAEIVALFLFVNSQITNPVTETGAWTREGWTAIALVVICIIGCFVFARVAAKQVDNPTYRLQGCMFVIALLIWIYAMDAKVLQVFDHAPIPALSGLLLVTFTMFSGLVVPTVKPTEDPTDKDGGQGSPDAPAEPRIPPNQSTASTAASRGGRPMTSNSNHFCMCLRNKPGNLAIEGAERAAVLREAKWQPGTRISVMFLSGSDALKARVRAVAEEWITPGMANLSFQWVDDVAADIRIAFISGAGSWSYLGTVSRQIPSPEPTMNYGWLTDASSDEELRRVVLHEFGHALGMIHEHQNPEGAIQWNEAAVLNDLSGPPNNWDEATIRNNVLDRYDPNAVISTPVDKNSIMMYPIPAAWTDGAFSSDLNNELSETDKRLIREVYP